MVGALEPPPGKAPAYAQLYVLDNHAIVDVVKGMQFGAKLKEDREDKEDREARGHVED